MRGRRIGRKRPGPDSRSGPGRLFRDTTGEAGLVLLKAVVVLALLGAATVDAAMPLLTGLQLDHRAGRVVADLGTTLDAAGGDVQRAHEMVQLELDSTDPDVLVESIDVDEEGGSVIGRVTLSRRAGSLVLRDVLGLDSYYDVDVTRAGPVD